MPDSPPAATLDYVRASARFLNLPLDEDRLARVAVHLERTRHMMAALEALPLDVDVEPAEVFKPAPFPPGSDS
jgi:hypothetical protein